MHFIDPFSGRPVEIPDAPTLRVNEGQKVRGNIATGSGGRGYGRDSRHNQLDVNEFTVTQSSFDINYILGPAWNIKLNNDAILSVSNLHAGGTMYVTVRGAHTPTWKTNYIWPGGSVPAYVDSSDYVLWSIVEGEIRIAMVQGTSFPSDVVLNTKSNTYTGDFIQLLTETTSSSAYFAINKSTDTAGTYRAIFADLGMGVGPGNAAIDTYLIRSGTNELSLLNQTLGAYSNLKAGTVTLSSGLVIPTGSTSAPGISFSGDSNTGIYSTGADSIDFVTGGSARWKIGAGGNLVPESDNSYDVGTSTGPLTVRNMYLKGSIGLSKTAFGTVEKFGINTPGTADNAATAIISTSAIGNKGLVIQRVSSSQTANLLEFQGSGGTVLSSFSLNGLFDAGSQKITSLANGSASTDAAAYGQIVPLSTVTTKGDLIAATGNAAVARQAVGTDGYRLSADSSTTNGVSYQPVDALLPTGAITQSYNRFDVATSNLGSALTSGQLMMWAVRVYPGQVLTSITFMSGTTALNLGTNQWAGLFDQSRVALRFTNNDTSTAWAANSAKTFTFTSTYTVPSATYWLYAGIMVSVSGGGSAVPSLVGASDASTNAAGLAPIVSGAADTGLTTVPSLPFTATTLTAKAQKVYFYLS